MPVVAAAVAVAVVAARGRAVEDAARELAGAVGRLRELRAPLGRLRAVTADTERLVSDFRAEHLPGGPSTDVPGD
ncbi:MAG TPA: hypothetical protein VFI47_30880 [Acidimicrobiales bacterium]|nr:hypothetical protein [Acidimicrobiales bacterium]